MPVHNSVTVFIKLGCELNFQIKSSYLTVYVFKSPLITSKLEHAGYLISE